MKPDRFLPVCALALALAGCNDNPQIDAKRVGECDGTTA